MRPMVAVAFAVAVSACAPHGRSASAERELGDYAFRFDVGTTQVEGKFSVLPDSIVVENIECHGSQPQGPLTRSRSFECEEPPPLNTVRVLFNAVNPYSATWSATKSELKSRQVCQAYATRADGTRYCTGYRTEMYEVRSSISGRMRVERVASR